MVLIGLVLGGGASSAVSQAQYNDLREEMNEKLDGMNDAVVPILVEMGKLQAMVAGLKDDIQELKEKR
jgi:archaellum component FlaC